MTQPDRIAAALSHGARTVAEIADATGLPKNHLRSILYRCRWRFVRVDAGERAGRWGLLAPSDGET